jgi:3-deoxy-D-manno-octulosonic-acid transferase
VRNLIRKILGNVNLFQVQTESDRERLVSIGGNPDQIEVTGNLKAEVELPEMNGEECARLKKSLGLHSSQKVIIAGSTHKGEDLPLLKAFILALKQQKDRRLILAPRHLARVREVEKLATDLDLKVIRRTALLENQPWEVLILDTLGELARLYAVSDIAFIGGSLIPWGGQNLLEPAFYGKPIYFGPYMDNFTHLAEIFVNQGAALTIHNESELLDMYLMQDKARLELMGHQARDTLLSLQGAAPKALKAIENLMKV